MNLIGAFSSSAQSESDSAAGFPSDREMMFLVENPMPSSSAHHLLDVMLEPEKGDLDPFLRPCLGSDVTMSSSSAHHPFDVMLEPEQGHLDPFLRPCLGSDVPHPLESLQGQLVPPFLWKTFDLVDDLALDSIVSWGSTGQSFVIWDPVEFSRVILPSNFKHSNFSSFVRQLNTYVGIAVQPLMAAVGFRKIDTDKWEFTNEGFQRGKRHLLKNIQRRKSPQSQRIESLIVPSIGERKSEMEDEIGRLKKERSMLMQEVVELQQQQKATVQYANTVNQRLLSAEQRQKHMISFLAKLLRNPEFLFCMQRKKEHKEIDSPRTKRKFDKQHKYETSYLTPSMEGQIVKYKLDWESLVISSTARDSNPSLLDRPSAYLPQGISGELVSNPESMSNFQFENASSSDVIASEELAFHHGYVKPTEELMEEAPNMEDQHFKGKTIESPSQELNPHYFPSLAEDNLQFSHHETGSFIQPGEIWNAYLNGGVGTSCSSTELWSNQVIFEDPFMQVSSGLSSIRDLASLQAGDSGTYKWSTSDFPFNDPDSQGYPNNVDDSENK